MNSLNIKSHHLIWLIHLKIKKNKIYSSSSSKNTDSIDSIDSIDVSRDSKVTKKNQSNNRKKFTHSASSNMWGFRTSDSVHKVLETKYDMSDIDQEEKRHSLTVPHFIKCG